LNPIEIRAKLPLSIRVNCDLIPIIVYGAFKLPKASVNDSPWNFDETSTIEASAWAPPKSGEYVT
jgi:hypothetical protein